MSITLPKLTKAKFFGYGPIFSKTLQIEIKNDVFILLGGNGLGKTTLLQSIIYALGGPLDSKIETSPDKRWSKKYFTDRFSTSESSYIELEFKLGDDNIKIKRGFQTEKLLEFFVNGKEVTDNKSEIEPAFENYLISKYNYDSLTSFRFLIHKLCYLSEKRENLVWDTDVQTRILMLIFSDTLAESSFRTKNDQLQKFDSKIRHLQVDINKVEDKINSLSDKKPKAPAPNTKIKEDKRDKEMSELKSTYLSIFNKKFELQKSIRRSGTQLSSLNSEIEDIQDKITLNEQQFLYKQITSYESEEAKLAIHKLIHHKICPACSSQNTDLYSRAIGYLNNASCPICGTHQDSEIKKMAPGLEAELSEKIRQKVLMESTLISFEKQLNELQDQENKVQYAINKYLLESPSVVFVKDYHRERTSIEDLKSTLRSLKRQQTDFQLQFDKLKFELEKEYGSFQKRNNERLDQLSRLYQKYATEFLGIDCSLIPIDNKRDLLELKLFVPSFNNIVRNTADTCSEAQRFFLDIAFRMALIEMVCTMTKTNATFICETPENALDITYRNNVAEMFRLFMSKKNTVLITSNIQPQGIAESILLHVPVEKRKDAILNFLEVGKLSEVQAHDKKNLSSIVKKLLTQKM